MGASFVKLLANFYAIQGGEEAMGMVYSQNGEAS